MNQKTAEGASRRTGLRQRLLITLACALSPILVLGALQSVLNNRHSLEQRRVSLIRSADVAIDGLEQTFAKAESYLEIFQRDIVAGRCQTVQKRLSEQLTAMANIGCFNTEGVATCMSDGPVGISQRNPEWTRRLKAGEHIIRTEAFYGPVSEAYLFSILQRVDNEDGSFAGSISLGINAEKLADFLEDSLHNDEIDISIVTGSGQVFGGNMFSQVDPDWVDESKLIDGSRLITGHKIAGAKRDIVVTKIATQNMYVLVTGDSPGIFSELTLAPMSAIGLPFLAFLIALLAVWWSVDLLVLKWLHRLNRVAAVYGAGKYKLRSADRFDASPEEIAEFAETLDSMAERIASRDRHLREALEKRDAAVKEIHHRVKNNLQIVTSFLNLQSRQVKDVEARNALASARHRIDALSIVHQTLYQHERLERVSLRPFLTGLLQHLSQALGMDDLDIRMKWSIEDVERDADDAIPLALFIVEAVTNAVKHGLLDGGALQVDLHKAKSETGVEILELIVLNDLSSVISDEDLTSTGLGSRLMNAFASQLHGSVSSEVTQDGQYRIVLQLIPRDMN